MANSPIFKSTAFVASSMETVYSISMLLDVGIKSVGVVEAIKLVPAIGTTSSIGTFVPTIGPINHPQVPSKPYEISASI